MKERIIKGIAKGVILHTGIIDKVAEKIDKKTGLATENLIQRNPQNNHLWLSQYDPGKYIFRSSYNYNFVDDYGNLRFYAVGEKNNKLQRIKLFDQNQTLLGEIHEKRDIINNPFGSSLHYNFAVIINKKDAGHIKISESQKASVISLNNNEWYSKEKNDLKSFFSFFCISIYSKDGKSIAEIIPKSSSLFIDFPSDTNVIKLLLFVLAKGVVSIIKNRKEGKY